MSAKKSLTAKPMIGGLSAIADERGCSLAQLAISWQLHQPGIAAPIIGPRTMDQLIDELGALDVELTESDLTRINEIAPPGQHTVAYYGGDDVLWEGWSAPHFQW